MKFISTLVVAAIGAGLSPIASAQLAPVCREAAADADGDGFGWQDNDSCIVTQESEPAPEFTHLETNEFINLTRAYWNPPKDLYNKTVTCIAHNFQRSSGRYVADNDPGRETHYSFHYTHLPLTPGAPYTGTVKSEHIVTAGPRSDYYYKEFLTKWSMDNGIYTGAAPFTESPYVELVTVPSTDEKAIRTWRSDSSFVQCSAQPTGVPPSSNITAPESNTNNDTNENDSQNTTESTNENSSNNTEADSNTDSTNNNGSTENSNSDAATPVVSNDATVPVTELSSTTIASSGGGAIGYWLVLLLTVFNYSKRAKCKRYA